MERTLFRRASAALLAAGLLVAACGDDDDTTAGDTTTTAMADHDAGDAAGHDDGHDHDEGIEVGDQDPIPTIAVSAEADSVAGVNVNLETTGFEFSPEHASTEHVAGEGHAHVYVDGEKVGRVYENWIHLGDVAPGEHEIRVELNANSHSPLLVDGAPIDETVTVDVPEPAEGHAHGGDGFEASDPVPSVSIEAVADPKSGYNVRVTPTDFTFTPEKVGDMETASGEGHAHLYVDGQKVTRLYGEWYHLDGLDAGEHELRAVLSANDHSDYVVDGETIEATTTVTVEGEPEPSDADQVIEVSVADGAVDGGGRTSVSLGDTVTIRVTSDVDDHIHLHGYDVLADIAAGETAELTFDATIPGVFEVELEDARLPLLELEIS